MQGDIERKTYTNLLSAGRSVIKERGFVGLYNGATFRYGRQVCGIFLMDSLQGIIGPALYPEAFK